MEMALEMVFVVEMVRQVEMAEMVILKTHLTFT